MAMPSSHKLMIMAATVHRVGPSLENPWEYFNPMAHPISNNPARTRINHVMLIPFGSGVVPNTA
jgi:hypothetical protein